MSSSTLVLSRQQLVGECLKRAAQQSPNSDAFVCEGIRVTYQQMDERASQLAGWLQEQGVKHDEKVGFILKNGLPFIETFFGIALSGGVGVPMNFRLAAGEIEYIVNNSDSKILIIDSEYVNVIEKIRKRLPKVEKIIVVGSDHSTDEFISYNSIYEQECEYKPVEQLRDEDGCMIVYTSGTTGRPKGAVLTHKNLFQNGMNCIWEFKLKFECNQLIVTPLFHVAAMNSLVTICLVKGTTFVHRDFDPVQVLQTIEVEKINTLFLVPAMWNFLLQVPNVTEYDVSSMKTCMTGAAICPLEIKENVMKLFSNAGIYDVFGQTEMSPATTVLQPEDAIRKMRSVGRPFINVEVRVVDEDMNDVPVGEVGEIVYRGPTLMKEYYNNPEATEEAFKGGWFHSGDLVQLDDEGFVYVMDRKKDMIISGGENIYPAEIEDVLYKHKAILEVAIVGVPDPEWGENVKAYVVLKPNCSLTEQEVITYCASHLASYKKPKHVEFLDALPRNAAGKVLKYVLKSSNSRSNEKIQ
ncbi:acyl-CoA synthetase [Alkalihalobacterium chitinilyticum]|uniref:Long-chain fatty acid--CoA ligase n=1 Tax=Alkalihalobacterium chitinilyticum TaxID=2980103 RepID=A0ABT5VIF3_9BACI|nr:long-chain fatty acid--CoA ligase [Alkalihalobacterium chitinilyticum]MDE5414522.1 long-chain fatty acid--CoA ligase [Alkalihalobacterium chitinilyticum]